MYHYFTDKISSSLVVSRNDKVHRLMGASVVAALSQSYCQRDYFGNKISGSLKMVTYSVRLTAAAAQWVKIGHNRRYEVHMTKFLILKYIISYIKVESLFFFF